MTSAEDINKVFPGIGDPEAETLDEDYEEEGEHTRRASIPTKSTNYLPVIETQRGETLVLHPRADHV